MHDILAAVFQPGAALVTMTALGHEALLHEVTVAHAFLVQITDAVRRRRDGCWDMCCCPTTCIWWSHRRQGRRSTLMRRVTIGFNQDYGAHGAARRNRCGSSPIDAGMRRMRTSWRSCSITCG
ncbi:MAG: hypothetical protein R2854_25690 [Caldilineaceae bacterium]